MAVITVLGEIDEGDLGVVLPHEHLLADLSQEWDPPAELEDLRDAFRPLTPDVLDRSRLRPLHYYGVLGLSSPAAAVEELKSFTDAGGKTVVDLTPWSVGRKPHVLRAISRLAGVHVVMGSGEYRQFAHSPFVRFASVEQLRDMMIADVMEGTDGIRAGIIGELGTGNPVTDDEKKVLRAAAEAHLATGVSINIHRTPWPEEMAGLDGLDLLLRQGVRPDRIVISHCDERAGAAFALEVGKRGAFISCDTFGMERWSQTYKPGEPKATREDRIRIVEELLAAGYLGQLLLSHDVGMQTMLERNGGYGYGHLDRDIVPLLLKSGTRPEDMHTIRVANPARSLAVGT
jgi:phosphotriesterase-related protein